MGRPKSRAVRKVALIKAQMRAAHDWIEIAIGNVSASGLMAKCARPPAPGTTVEIRRRRAIIVGIVVWATPTRFGVASSEPIDVDELTASSGLEAQQADTGQSRKRLWHWRQSR